MSNKTLETIKELYKRAGMEEQFDTDLENGVIAKINVNDNKMPYEKYAKLYTSIFTIDSCKYQYFIFKPGYSYKNGKLFFKINENSEIKNNNFDKNLDK